MSQAGKGTSSTIRVPGFQTTEDTAPGPAPASLPGIEGAVQTT